MFFYNKKFCLFPGIYLPKHETEHVLLLIEEIYCKFKINNLLEIGVGSGCISILIKLLYPIIDIDVVDKQYNALANTRFNSYLYNVCINMYHLDILDNIFNSILDRKYDVVVSNIPYLNFDEFLSKYNNKLTSKHIDDYNNCVGGIFFANIILYRIKAKYYIFEISEHQIKNLDQSCATIIKIIKPFINSKIVFVMMASVV